MKFGVVNKSTTVNRFVLHTLQRNIMHLAGITCKTNIKFGFLKGGNWKRATISQVNTQNVYNCESSKCFFADLKFAGFDDFYDH